jgi:hypothetical protein
MKSLFDAFWRAAAYCLHPQVIALSVLPLLVSAALAFGLGYFFWEPAIDGVRGALESFRLVDGALGWLESMTGARFRVVLAPMIVLMFAVPLIIVVSVLLVSVMATPAVVRLVAARRYPQLERKRGASLLGSILWSALCTLAALVLLVLSLPLWLVPPLILVLPPLIWGWLTTQVMAFDALAEHASRDERKQIMKQHRWPLLAIGVVTGYLGAAPSMLFAFNVLAVALLPVVAVAVIWMYTLIFIFSACWFSHYALTALEGLRRSAASESAAVAAGPPADPAAPAGAPAAASPPALPPGATAPAPVTDLLPPP